ncbi:MAG: hypothetical protein ABUL46_06530 [Chitinophaga rupis]
MTVVRLVVPRDGKGGGGDIRFSKANFYHSIRKKKVTRVDLDEEYSPRDARLVDSKFKFITREVERLAFTHDTTEVLKIEFDSTSTYGNFVWVLNQALIYRYKRYVYVDDSFYFLANPPEGLPTF